MKLLRAETGFTFIEVTLVMAITAALGGVLLFGQGSLRQNAQFDNSMEQIKNAVVQAKNEADTSVSLASGSTAIDASAVYWGKRVTFSSDHMTVQTLVLDDAAPVFNGPYCSGSTGPFPKMCITDTTDIDYKWGIRLAAAPGDQIVFRRDPANGKLETFAAAAGSTFNYRRPVQYNLSDPTVRSIRNIGFIEPGGRTATIVVDPTTQDIKLVYN